MESAIDTTKNAQERIEFAFNAINNLEGQNLESILSNKENVIETYKLARDKEHISNIKTDHYSNILEYGNSETLYDGYNNGSLNESFKNDINTSLSGSYNESVDIVQEIRYMVVDKILERYPDLESTFGGNKKTRKHKNKVNKKNKSKKNKNKSKKNKSKKNKNKSKNNKKNKKSKNKSKKNKK
jgi:hypothetical protein